MSTVTDEDLMTAVRNGDLAKLGPLFERYHAAPFDFLSWMTGDRTAAEDRHVDGVQSFNGNVDVTLPASVKANVKMRSNMGEIFTDFDVQMRPVAPVPQTVRGG